MSSPINYSSNPPEPLRHPLHTRGKQKQARAINAEPSTLLKLNTMQLLLRNLQYFFRRPHLRAHRSPNRLVLVLGFEDLGFYRECRLFGENRLCHFNGYEGDLKHPYVLSRVFNIRVWLTASRGQAFKK